MLILGLLFIVTNIYSQNAKFNDLLLNHENRSLDYKYQDQNGVMFDQEQYEQHPLRNMQKQNSNSSSVVDSVLSKTQDGENAQKNIYTYDFTISDAQAYENNQADLGDGAYGMFSGDFNADGIVDDFDLSTQWYLEAGYKGFKMSDGNLDIQVNNDDKNLQWYGNVGETEQFPDVGFVNCGDLLPDDRDGQIYTTVQIGPQCWMAENLNIGSMIPGTSNPSDNGVIEKYCFDNNAANCDSRGAFYLWDELMEYTSLESGQGICPDGWHIPSHAEWCTMEQHLDPTVVCDDTGFRGTDVGTQLKQGGASGFEALLAGQRQFNGTFDHLDFRGYFWTSTEAGILATMRFVQSNDARVYRWNTDKIYGFNVRCVLD